MTERYAFRYMEYLVAQKEENKVFAADSASPLIADITARLQGLPFVAGDSPLAALGVRVLGNDEALQKLLPDAADYGADALRVAVLENRADLTHSQKAAQWRLVDKLWQVLKNAPLGCVQDWENPAFYPVIEAMQKNDLKSAWISLKTVLHTDTPVAGVAFGLYPFLPHLMQSLYPDIHSKMPLFWQFIKEKQLPPCYFIEVNGRRVADFYPSDSSDFEKIKKEALSFVSVQNKIANKTIQKVINISGKGLNFVV